MKYLFFLLLPLAYLAGNVYLFFRGKARNKSVKR